MYVVNNGGQTVSVIRGTTNVANVSLGFRPSSLRYDPTTGYVYVPDSDGNNISVISGTQVIASIMTGVRPSYALYDPANGYIYVSNAGFGGICVGCQFEPSNVVSIIAGTSIVENITVGYGTGFLLYNPGNHSVDVITGDGMTVIGPASA